MPFKVIQGHRVWYQSKAVHTFSTVLRDMSHNTLLLQYTTIKVTTITAQQFNFYDRVTRLKITQNVVDLAT